MADLLSGLSADAFLARLSAALRDKPRGTAAVIDDFCVAWVDGPRVVLAYLRDDGTGEIDEEFDLTDCVWSEWVERAQTWLRHPVITDRYRAQLLGWMTDASAARRSPA